MDYKQYLKSITSKPGVYQFLNHQQKTVYVGKAKNLKNRLSSYFQKNLSPKTAHMMTQVVDVQVTVTETETEALLLECNLIKKLKPRYNILLRDDKTYPYIYLSAGAYPRLDFYRGNKTLSGRYFGPYPSTQAVRDTLNLMQKLFLIRQCKETFFKNRSRPCLQYQIGRCKAPCVQKVTQAEYAKDIEHAVLFLEGKDQQVVDALIAQMQQAAKQKHYELAAHYRDQVAQIRQIQTQQVISHGDNSADVVALACQDVHAVVVVLRIRAGRLLANQQHYPKVPKASQPSEILEAFLSQYYLNSKLASEVAPLIVCSHALSEKSLLEETLSAGAGRRVTLSYAKRGERAKWLKLAVMNAQNGLTRLLDRTQDASAQLQALQMALRLLVLPQRIECFDISHTSGKETYASCVVFDAEGLNHPAYRRFKVSGVAASDDYAAMAQAVKRRFKRLQSEKQDFPDILLIDGGKGQVAKALEMLEALEVKTVLVVGIAKGRTRKPGMETLFMNGKAFVLDKEDPGLHVLQLIRDEAHRFAITGHRRAREKKSQQSSLQAIPGVGAMKRRQLLTHFGGLQGVAAASIDALCKVKGVNLALAQKIYDALHR